MLNNHKGQDIELPYQGLITFNSKRRKVAQSMYVLHQLNIFDLKTRKVNGYRIKGTDGFSQFDNAQIKSYMAHYLSVISDDRYIYALYYGNKVELEVQQNKEPIIIHTIYVFDWDGNLVKKFDLDHSIREFCVDNKSHYIYGMDLAGGGFYRYNVKNFLPR